MSALASSANNIEAPGFPGVSFGVSADGLTVALVGDHAYAMVPARDGKHFLASGWLMRHPMPEWTRKDFLRPSWRACRLGRVSRCRA